jgi:DNA-binding SARP family transcriptional activator
MQINVLGPLEAWQDGNSVVPTARKPRQVLSLLAVNAGQMVPVPALVEELWGFERAPRSATQVVQTYILRLRECIGNGGAGSAKQVLTTRPGGYALEVAPEDVDVHRFQRLAQAGEQALLSGDHRAASSMLGGALELWRGPVLVDVTAGVQLGVEVERLDQSRLTVLGELAELTARYPLHEKLCEQYMTALYLCGCKWRALEVFQRLRQNLVNELGIEPSVHVRQVQRAILNADVNWEASLTRRQVPVAAAG